MAPGIAAVLQASSAITARSTYAKGLRVTTEGRVPMGPAYVLSGSLVSWQSPIQFLFFIAVDVNDCRADHVFPR